MTDLEAETLSLVSVATSSSVSDAASRTSQGSESPSAERQPISVRSKQSSTSFRSTDTNGMIRLSRAVLLLLFVFLCLLLIIEESLRLEHSGLLFGNSHSDLQRGICADITIPVKDEWGARRLELLFRREQIPDINLQPTKNGQILRSLWAFDGRLHLGYGDETNNTGPISMHAWDPTQQAWVFLGTLYTEQMKHFRPGPGVLYSPEADAKGEERSNGVYELKCGSMSWSFAGNPINGSAHLYDLAVQGSRILVGTGSRSHKPAFLMASDDQGETWMELFRHESPPGMYSRIYNVGATDNVTFVSGRVKQHGESKSGFAYIRYTGEASFEPISNMEIASPQNSSKLPYLVPVTHRQEMVITAFTLTPPRGQNHGSYRISGKELIVDDPWPKINGKQCSLENWAPDPNQDRLLVLMQCSDRSAGVFRTASLERDPVWETALLLPPLKDDGDTFTSMSLLLNDLYLGTRHGNLYIVQELYRPA